MDAYHLYLDLNTTQKWDRVKIVALSGNESLVTDSVFRILARVGESTVTHLHPDSMNEIYSELSQTDVDAEKRVIVAHRALDLIDDSDVLNLERLTRKNYFQTFVIMTGKLTMTDDLKQVFQKASARKYDLDFRSSDSGRVRCGRWIEAVLDCSSKVSRKIMDECDYDFDRMCNLIMKLSYLGDISDKDVAFLAKDFAPSRFQNRLLMLDYAGAMSAVPDVSPNNVPFLLTQLSNSVGIIGQIHPYTRQAKIPGRQQVIDSKISLPTLQRWWGVAGRYNPEQQIKRQILLAQASHRYYNSRSMTGLLEQIVLSW